MESAEHVSKVAPSRAAAMEMRRMSLIRPLPSTDVNKVSEVSFESSSIRSVPIPLSLENTGYSQWTPLQYIHYHHHLLCPLC